MENLENNSQTDDNSCENKSEGFSNQADVETEDENIKDEHKMFSRRSIAVTASSIGIPSISDEVCRHVAEELYYKTKELIYMSKLILTQNKRSTLTTDDVKKAMKLLGGVEIYGHSSLDEVKFEYVPKADVFVEEDPEIEINEEKIADCAYTLKKDPYIIGSWIMPEGFIEDPSLMTPCKYTQKISKAILCGNPAHLRVALSDLRTNPKIGPICPYFLNLVALTLKNLPRTIYLSNALIGTVHAIAHNKYVDASPYLAANRAVNALLKITMEGIIGISKIQEEYLLDNDDDLTVRMRAGILLAKVVLMWSIELKQQVDIVRHLLQHLVNPAYSLQTHYGAIIALTTLGGKRLDYFWPIVEKFLALLESKIESKKYDKMVRHVMAVILVAARKSYKKQASDPEQLKRLYKVDKMLYSSFGDSVTPFRLVASPPIFNCERRKVQPSRLKLKLCWTKSRDEMCLWTTDRGDKIFSNSSNMSTTDSSNDKNFPYLCVKRNYKFCQPLYKKSASGDLLLIL